MDNDNFDVDYNNESDNSLYYCYHNYNNVSGIQLYSSEMGVCSSDSIDYSSNFADIINRFETLIAYDSSDGSAVTLDTIHHDLGIIVTILLVFMTVFVGHGFVSKFRNL